MVKMLSLSRARFYQLLEQGIFPQPIYDLRTHRPLYDAKLQMACLEVRETGIGANNQYMLFYSPRKKDAQSRKIIKKDSVHVEFAETLNSMGLDCSVKDVSSAISELYPDVPECDGIKVVLLKSNVCKLSSPDIKPQLIARRRCTSALACGPVIH